MMNRLHWIAVAAAILAAMWAHPASADVYSIDAIIREDHSFGSGPDGSNPDQDSLNTSTSPSLWLDATSVVGAGVDGSAVPFSFNSQGSQVSNFSEALGTFSATLSTAATSSYAGAESPASASGFSLYDIIFTITTPVTYSFTATNTGDAPFLFQLTNFDTTLDEFGGFSNSGSGTLAAGEYGLALALFSTSTSDQNGSDGTKNSDLIFDMSLTPSPVPEPATVWVLASMSVVGLAAAWRRKVSA